MARKTASGGQDTGPEEKVYEWDVARVGDEAPPYVFEVTAESIADYCRAVRYENPAYVHDGAAREMGFPGVFAPPTMLFVYAPQRRHDLMRARGFVAPEQSSAGPRSTPCVSANVRFQGALVRPGDVITSSTRVVDKPRRGRNKFITFWVSAHNQRDELVADYDYVCLWETATRKTPHDRPQAQEAQ